MSQYADIMGCTNLISDASYAVTIQRIRAVNVPGAEAKLDAAEKLLEAARRLVIEAGDCVPLELDQPAFQLAAE